MKYKKIAIFGFPASGKSTFAKFLNEITKIPVYSLDLIRWSNMKDGKKDDEYFQKEYKKILLNKEWIIEGNALDYIKSRLEQADILYFFNTGVDESIKNYLNRDNRINNGLEERLAFDMKAKENDDVIEWIKTRYAKKIEKLVGELECYKDKLVVIHNYNELNNEIKTIEDRFSL